jgi:intein/homing endonuclease
VSLDHLDLVDHLLSGGKTWQTDFWERPLSIEEFCTDPEHLTNVRLSERQLTTLKNFLGDDPILIFDKKSTRPNVCVLCWGKGCLVADSVLTLASGRRATIADLLRLPEGDQIQVPSYNPTEEKLVVANASRPFWRGRGECFTVRTASGRQITVFGEHLFYARQKQGPAWVPLRELKVGSRIALPQTVLAEGSTHDPEAAVWIGRAIGESRPNQGIPGRYFTYDRVSVWQMLCGLWATSGWLRPDRGSWELGFATDSEVLARDVAELLHRQGVVARIAHRTRSQRGQPQGSWVLTVRDNAMVRLFLENVPLRGESRFWSYEAQTRLSGTVSKAPTDGLYWDKIVEIVSVGVQDYYDLEVEETECYVAQGLLHHNSGKNMTTTILQQYMLYLLLCMRDPLTYFGFPHGESIDMLNVASSAAQAQKNFFNKFTRRIKTWKWLKEHFAIVQHGRPLSSPTNNRGTIRITDDSVQWDGGVQCISAHSDSKGYEGYSPVFWVMDEASSWDTEYVNGENGEQIAMSRAHSIFDTLRTSSVSRSWKWAGLIISYPRNEDDFTLGMAQAIQRGDIKDAIADIASTWDVKPKQMWVSEETFTHKVIRPWGTFEIYPPKDFEEEFRLHPTQSELKYACVPSRTNTYFIYQNTKIHECQGDVKPIVSLRPITFTVPLADGPVNQTLKYVGYSIEKWLLDPGNDPNAGNYYAHIDLSVNSDTTTLAIGHGEPFEAQIMVQSEEGEELAPLSQRVVIDQIIEWTPDQAHLISTINVDDILEQLDDKLRFRYVSIDQYESARVLEKMAKRGREAGKHNVRNAEYLLLRSLIHANAITYPRNPKLVEELEKLVWNGKRVDHLPHYSKDRADAIAGVARSIFLKRGRRKQRIKFMF